MQIHHRFDGNEDIAEEAAELLEIASKASRRADFVVELFLGQLSGFKPKQQRRMINKTLDLRSGDF